MDIDSKKILEELAAVAFAQVSQAYDENGQADPARAGPALAGVEKTAQGIKLKFYDKLKALELLGKHYGLWDGSGTSQEVMKQGILEAFLKEDTHGICQSESAAEAGHELVEPGQV